MPKVFKIGITKNKNQKIREVEEISVSAGEGIIGDRYFNESTEDRNQLTLIESENIDYYNQKFNLKIPYLNFRRNIVTKDIKLNELMKIAEPYKMENYINIISDDFEWDTNWKLLTENFMEGYHLPVAHPETVGPFINVMDTEFDKRGSFKSFTYQYFTKNRDAPVGTAHPENNSLKGKWRHTSILPTVFPSHMYSLAPDHYWYLSLLPSGVGKVKIRFGAAIAPEVLNNQNNPDKYIKDTRNFLYKVQEEDRYVVEGIYKGVNSPLGKPGPLSWLERENHEFTQYIARMLTALIL